MSNRTSNDLTGDGGVLLSLEQTLLPGSPTVVEGQSVTLRYEGMFPSTQITFDSGIMSFVVGRGEVIEGVDQAVRHLSPGMKATVAIRHDYGYGEAGLPGKIPPHAALLFNLEVVSCSSELPASGDSLPALPPSNPLASSPASEEGLVETLVVGGASLKMDRLGPIVLNTDGSTSRISNWHEMTSEEQENTMRLIARRNKKRIEAAACE